MVLLHLTCLAFSVMARGAPTTAVRTDLHAVGDSILPVDALIRLTTFWTLFKKEPDSIRKSYGTPQDPSFYLKEIELPVGQKRLTMSSMDMGRKAAKTPSVAADLKQAGLSPAQYDLYNSLLMSALLTLDVDRLIRDKQQENLRELIPRAAAWTSADLKPTSVEEVNIEFLKVHEEEFKTLRNVLPAYLRMVF